MLSFDVQALKIIKQYVKIERTHIERAFVTFSIQLHQEQPLVVSQVLVY